MHARGQIKQPVVQLLRRRWAMTSSAAARDRKPLFFFAAGSGPFVGQLGQHHAFALRGALVLGAVVLVSRRAAGVSMMMIRMMMMMMMMDT
jgi:hypothetical protein